MSQHDEQPSGIDFTAASVAAAARRFDEAVGRFPKPDLACEPIVRQPGAHVARAGELIPDYRRVLAVAAETAAAPSKMASLRALHLESKESVARDIASAFDRTRAFADAAVKSLGETGRDEVLSAVAKFFTDELARLR
jgi:hypothetical protein